MAIPIIVALIATPAFYRTAQKAGIAPGRAASLPFIVLCFFFLIQFLGSELLTIFTDNKYLTDRTSSVIEGMLNATLVVAYLIFIGRNWRRLATFCQK